MVLPVLFVLFLPFIYLCGICAFAFAPVFFLGCVAFSLGRVGWVLYVDSVQSALTQVQATPLGSKILQRLPIKKETKALASNPQALAEIEAEIAEVTRIVAKLPKTALEAAERLTEAQDLQSRLESALVDAEAAAKANSGQWMALCEARENVEHARMRVAEASRDLDLFPKEISDGSHCPEPGTHAADSGNSCGTLGAPAESPPKKPAVVHSVTSSTIAPLSSVVAGQFAAPNLQTRAWAPITVKSPHEMRRRAALPFPLPAFVPPAPVAYKGRVAPHSLSRPFVAALRRL